MNLLEEIRAQIREVLTRRAQHATVIDEITDGAAARAADGGDSALTEDESTRFNEARSAIVKIDDEELPPLQARETELAEVAERRAAADELARRIGNPPPGPAPVVSVTNEPDLYRDGGEYSFLADLYRQQVTHDSPQAADRLQRHQAHEVERRAATTANFGGLIPPQYLLDLYAPLARAGRPFSNAVWRLPLPPEGEVFNIPRITTGTTTGVQAAQGDVVANQDIDDTNLGVSLRTIAGYQEVSRQSLERGVNIDRIVFGDLAADYAVRLNAANIAALLATAGIHAVTYTDASPTLAEIHPKLADAVQRVNGSRFLPATFHLMHPRRWGWMTGQVDTTGRPLVVSSAATNPVGVGEAAQYGQVVGILNSTGLPVITDAGVPTNLGAGTNEDIIVTCRGGDLGDIILWEENDGAPRELRFEARKGTSLMIDLVAYGYSAFTAGRYPTGIATIGGTGLVTPTF